MKNWQITGRKTAKLVAAISHAKAIGINILCDVLMDFGLRVWNDNPEKQYPNRNGVGVRVYLEGQLLPKDES